MRWAMAFAVERQVDASRYRQTAFGAIDLDVFGDAAGACPGMFA
jgi:hypothetical protein